MEVTYQNVTELPIFEDPEYTAINNRFTRLIRLVLPVMDLWVIVYGYAELPCDAPNSAAMYDRDYQSFLDRYAKQCAFSVSSTPCDIDFVLNSTAYRVPICLECNSYIEFKDSTHRLKKVCSRHATQKETSEDHELYMTYNFYEGIPMIRYWRHLHYFRQPNAFNCLVQGRGRFILFYLLNGYIINNPEYYEALQLLLKESKAKVEIKSNSRGVRSLSIVSL